MAQAAANLELPTATYQALERIAALQGVTPANVVESFVRQFEETERLRLLRSEYRQLSDRALQRRITPEEEARLEKISEQINASLHHSALGKVWEERDSKADELIAQSKRLLEEMQSQIKGERAG